jgi:putative tricarboxylic transport membrane protein
MERVRSDDRIGGLVWLLAGLAIAYGSWTMDRLERLDIHPLAAPGLLPGIAGLALAGLGFVMLLRRPSGAAEEPAAEPVAWGRLGVSWALCVAFGGLLLGRGLPFWLLAGAFVLAHILILHDGGRGSGGLVRRFALAAAVAVGAAGLVTWAFETLFLIRLP